MKKKYVYNLFQYFISFMAILCILIILTNSLFSENHTLKCIAAIIDIPLTTFIVLYFVRPNSREKDW